MFRRSLVILLIGLFSCTLDKPAGTLFTLLESEQTHIHFSNELKESEQMNMVEYLYFNNGGGVAAGDINNDGWIDLYFTASQQSNRLYLNKGNFEFEDITAKAGVAVQNGWSTGVTMADVNGDGWLDIHVCMVGNYKGLTGRNRLFINNRDLTFTEQAGTYGLDFSGFSTQAAFFDYDVDGDLDMYLLNHSVHGRRSYGMSDLRFEMDSSAGDRLFRQETEHGQPVFRDVTKQAGILSSQIGYGLGVSVADLNNDHLPDIYISNDFHEIDYLYINNGDGTFSERFTSMMTHGSRSSMGNDIADFNNDGLLDVIVLDMLPDKEEIRKRSGGEDDFELYEIKRTYGYYHQFVRNTLQYNLGGSLFSEIGRLAGIHSTDWSWSPLFCDLDNDGYKDIYITNGIYRRANDLDYVEFLVQSDPSGVPNSEVLSDEALYGRMPVEPLINFVFRNKGGDPSTGESHPDGLNRFTFENQATAWGMDRKSYSNGASYADLDNDGDLDIIVNNINEKAFIYRNNAESINDNHYLQISLKGPEGNAFGLGTRVNAYAGGTVSTIEQNTTRGFLSAVSQVLHLGLGRHEKVDSLVVYWPGNRVEKLYNIPVDQMITLDFLDATEWKPPAGNSSTPWFRQIDHIIGLDFQHKEDAYNELREQHLIPHNLSFEGPALAVGDVNQDGIDDVYIGGAKGQRPALYLWERESFVGRELDWFNRHYGHEDVDAAFFDADRDGDLDLYVVSGGNEQAAIPRLMKDRLYLNNGDLDFEYAEDHLPDILHNGSCVRPCDFDQDGDLDLFIGSRSQPGVYGMSPRSFLLENDGTGKFTDITRLKAPELEDIGMVTDAVWVDIDGDADDDLAIVGEWMPVMILENRDGDLIADPLHAGVTHTEGWWFSIEAADIDLDGDMDLVAGNLGLNTLLKASPEGPVRMYVDDLNKDGKVEQIITLMKQGKEQTMAYRDDFARQLDWFEEAFPTHQEYAGKSVDELFTEEQLEGAIQLEAWMFSSAVFLNDGNGEFRTKPLPAEIQFAPVRDMVVKDFSGDGIPDMLVAGNMNHVRPLYGRYEASYGWILIGKGNGDFSVLYPEKSGFEVRGEVNKLGHLTIAGRSCILVARNDEKIMAFEVIPP